MTGSTARFRALLTNGPFRWYLLSQSAGLAGYAVFSIAIVWLTLELTGSLFWSGLLLFVELGIYALSFLAGPTVDRSRDLRTILIVGYPLQAAVAASIGVLAVVGRLNLPSLALAVAVLSVVWDFTWIATQAALPRIVPQGELFQANGLVSAAGGVDAAVGFVCGGTLLLLAGPAVAMLLYAAFNLAAGLLALPLFVPKEPSVGRGYAAELSDGFSYLTSPTGRPALELSVFSSAQGLLAAAPPLLIALVASTRYGDPTFAYGLLFVTFALGGTVGSLAIGGVNPRKAIARVLVGSVVLEGVLVGFSVLEAPSYIPTLPGWFGVGVVDTVFFTTTQVYLQATTPAVLLGRTLSNAYVMRGGGRAFGALLVGALTVAVAPVLLGSAVGLGFVVVAAAGVLALPALRHLAF